MFYELNERVGSSGHHECELVLITPPESRGFTLIEVMVTVAIVAILASIAVPSYQDYVRRSQLQEAFTALADYSVKMEQYYLDNKNYGAASGTDCATANSASAWNSFSPNGAKYFSFACLTCNTGQSYVVTATGLGSLTTGYVYTINQDGTKATTTYAGSAVSESCWRSGSAC